MKSTNKVITIDLNNITTPQEFQAAIKQLLGMPDFYGMNWDAYWDAITGLISLPDKLILEGWHLYKNLQPEDADKFEKIMEAYNRHEGNCECVYGVESLG